MRLYEISKRDGERLEKRLIKRILSGDLSLSSLYGNIPYNMSINHWHPIQQRIKKKYAKQLLANEPIFNREEELRKIADKVIADNPKACQKKDFLFGWCAVLTGALWNELGQPTEYWPYSVMYGEEEHVLLYSRKDNRAIDIAGNQFDEPFINKWPRETYSNFHKLTKKETTNLKHS